MNYVILEIKFYNKIYLIHKPLIPLVILSLLIFIGLQDIVEDGLVRDYKVLGLLN